MAKNIKSVYEGYSSFLGDVEKMHDFITMSMEDFLGMYSYLDERDYYATYDELMNISRTVCDAFCVAHSVVCAGCAYEKVCGDADRVEPCDGRRERD